jgi:hypothetical protein
MVETAEMMLVWLVLSGAMSGKTYNQHLAHQTTRTKHSGIIGDTALAPPAKPR